MTDDEVRLRRVEDNTIRIESEVSRLIPETIELRRDATVIRSDVARITGQFQGIERVLVETIQDDSRHARRATNIVTVFVSCFAALYAGLVVLGYFNYQQTKTEVEKTLDEVKKKSNELLALPSLDRAYVTSDDDTISNVDFDAVVERAAQGYILKIYANFPVYGVSGDEKYKVGKLIAMKIRFKGAIVNEMKATPLGNDVVAAQDIIDGGDWRVDGPVSYSYLSSVGMTEFRFTYSIPRASCADVHQSINRMAADMSSYVYVTPRLDSAKSPPKEKQLLIKMNNIVGTKKCEEL